MRHSVLIVLILACLAALLLACYSPVLSRDRQFAFRDAGHFYYPLYQRVQREWEEGRWPLWEPEENAGMPLLGNPTAAVLYPGKVIYAVLPYAWAARVYVVAHSLLAFAAMLILMRSWQVSWTGSGLGALAYAFGVPILFQYCNIIYLVGAAWLPLGVRAVDRWVRLGRRWGLIELAVVLAMQTLGGDPQSSYLLGLAGIGYAAGLAWGRRRAAARSLAGETDRPSAGSFGWWWVPLATLLIASWVVGTLILGQWLPTVRPKGFPPPALPWMRHVSPAVAVAWLIAGLVFLSQWRRRGWRLPLATAWTGLAGAAALAVAISAAQFLPVYEFTQQTSRAADQGVHDIYPFSIEPIRLTGLLWPDVMGVVSEGNTFWGFTLRLPGSTAKVWVPSLYMGCLILVLAMAALALRRGTPWRIWLTAILVVSLIGSLGQYTSPIWAARVLAAGTKLPALQDLSAKLGPLDKEDSTPIRLDRFLRDGDGSIYWWMTTLLPGFRQFRYPAKLFTFTALSLAALAGLGWDRLREGPSRRVTAFWIALLVATLAVLGGVLVERPAIMGVLRGLKDNALYGPFNPEGAFAAIVRSLAQTATVLALGLFAVRLGRTRPLAAGALVLVATTGDLAVANAHYVATVPQSVFETTPEICRVLEQAERDRPAPGPFRVHRMPSWDPPAWQTTTSRDRNQDMVVWERNTLQPKHGINYGIEYAHTLGTAELYDYDWYYGGFYWKVKTPQMAKMLNVADRTEVVYFPRRSFDMWNTRYFILPMYANGWRDEFRGYASMLIDTEPVYPDPAKFRGPENADAAKEWISQNDFQIRRNLREHPRAWVVHDKRRIAPLTGMSREERKLAMYEITYENDEIWYDDTLQVFDPRRLAWVERDDELQLARYLPGGSTKQSETVQVRNPDPQHVEIDVAVDRPGLVVLADVYYPGWELTIDGKPAPIYRVNRIMRGAAVPKGRSHLVYTYAPRSFREGGMISLAGLGLLVLFGVGFTLRPVDPLIAPQPEPAPGAYVTG
jgi:hypothetical protein